MRGLLWFLWIYVLPLLAPWALLYGVNATDPSVPMVRTAMPAQRFRADRCTWYCHNHGCRHRPVLPAVLTSDRYLFGGTIRGLSTLGRLFSNNGSLGYGIANLLVYCTVWPGLMYLLWVIAWRQHRELRRLSARAGS